MNKTNTARILEDMRTALSISSGIGGNNAAVVLQRWND